MDKLIILALFFTFSCGKEVKISNKLLETNSASTSTPIEGLLIRGVKDQIRINNNVYYISKYSSYSALEFVASKPLGTQTGVKFLGKIKNQEVAIDTILAK